MFFVDFHLCELFKVFPLNESKVKDTAAGESCSMYGNTPDTAAWQSPRLRFPYMRRLISEKKTC